MLPERDPKEPGQLGAPVDTFNAEARLSLKALEPDPLQAFTDRTVVGQEVRGTVEKVLPIGIFVDLGNGAVGLVPERPTRRVFLSGPESAHHAGVALPT
ncbi:hypothetical protein ABZ957_23385 [Streptomyces sp. NPDC046316]|uniref:hypothetical protein n=1 Tax=Streptomyces sp. NPDC046316 TaxID=3154494 RepID=UPI00340B34F1